MFESMKKFKFKMTEKPAVFLLVKESEYGIQTYINPDIHKFDNAYKKQLKSFLEGVVKQLEKK